MFCGKCGSQNPDESRFCAACGAPLQPASAAPPAGQPQTLPPTPTPPGQPTFVAPPTTSGKAVASLILGFLFFAPPAAIAAVVLGHMSLSDIRKSAGRIQGQGIAVGGLILGYLGILMIPILLITLAIAIPNFIDTRAKADQAAAVGYLRDINIAATSYAATYNNGFPPDLQTLSGIGVPNCDHAGLIDGILASGTRSGYIFTYTATAGDPTSSTAPKNPGPGCSAMGAGGYTVTADPVNRGTTGNSSYYTDSTGLIRVEKNAPATAESDPLE
jgi:type II secretory pathway pseudopilin PulG